MTSPVPPEPTRPGWRIDSGAVLVPFLDVPIFDIFSGKYQGGGPVSDQVEPTLPAPIDEDAFTEEDFGHPRGTLAIVLIYAVIFALSWAGLYVWQFLERGAPTH